MTTPILNQNRAYRKGLILGFTMAEISILIIFCLLLGTSFLVQEKNESIKKLSKENTQLTDVKSKLEEFNKINNREMEFDDIFQELTRQKYQEEKFKKIKMKLKEQQKQVEQLNNIKEKISNGENKESIEREIDKLLGEAEFSQEIKALLSQKSLDNFTPHEIVEIISSSQNMSNLIKEKEETLIEVERLKGQLANAQVKLDRLGKGTEMPACWADARTGRPEYIFKIDLTGKGLIIHDQHLSQRINDQKLLPIQTIIFDKNLSQREFLNQTLPLTKWSIEHNCRFFVIAKDETAVDQKNVYKSMLRTLESHFYKFEQ